MKKAKSSQKKWDVWTLIAIFLFLFFCLFLIYPLANLLRNSFLSPEGKFSLENFQKFFSRRYYMQTAWNSFVISSLTTIFSLLIGLPLAYFYNMYKIRGAKFLRVVIIMCGMSAPFIGAYSWILLCGRNGLVTNFFMDNLGIQLPSIYGLRGIVLVETLQLFPLVFIYLSGAFEDMDASLIEAARSLGTHENKIFFKMVMPLLAPTIIASTLLVFMRAFADFGTPLFIGQGYRTFPVEIYNSFMAETGQDSHFAAAVSVIAILITLLIFLFQHWLNGKFQFTMSSLHPIQKKETHGLSGFFMHLFCYLVVFIAYAPQLYVIYTSFLKTSGKIFVPGFTLDSYRQAWPQLSRSLPNTILIGGLSLLLIIVISIFIAYLVVRRPSWISNLLDSISMIPYVIPGAVIGIALAVSFSRPPLVLIGGYSIMIICMVIRRNAYNIRSSIATLQQIPLSVEEAARSLGSSKLGTFFKVTVPMMASGIKSGSLLSWTAIITELSGSIILYNYSTITLTIQIYTFVSRGSYGLAAATATILTLLTMLSLFLFYRVSEKGRKAGAATGKAIF